MKEKRCRLNKPMSLILKEKQKDAAGIGAFFVFLPKFKTVQD